MGIIIRLIFESLRMASAQLWSNKLRSFLSLLGITIGIFCIIAVMSAIDSLEYSIKSGFAEMGSDVVYIDKFSWAEDPKENFWKWQKRPDPSLKDYNAIKRKSKLAKACAFSIYVDAKTIKYKTNSISGGVLMITTNEHRDINDLKIGKGRYWNELEYNSGKDVVILGAEIAEEIFENEDPLGKDVKLYGRPFRVIGVLEDEGDSFVSFTPNDQVAWIGINTGRKFFAINENMDRFNEGRKILSAKVKEGVPMEHLKDELVGILRASRMLKPTEESDFAVNDISLFSDILDKMFGAFNIAGFSIGIFALIVGMISVANIMFVSVKERTNLIGIKKAIGAKRYMVLCEFLIEAIVLCCIGGVVGLLFVVSLFAGLANVIPFEMFLSIKNMTLGVSISIVVGIVSGFIPALQAARMDPVVAMRQ